MKLPQDIAARLATRFGLDPNLCQGTDLAHIVKTGIESHGLKNEEAYFDRLRTSPQDFEGFAEMLLIPESWFFRDRVPFHFLGQWLLQTWLPAHPDATLKVLSLPCAGGQEPYSIAITLLENGLPPGRFQVLAGDLSPRLVEQAREGRYRAMAFRGGELFPREKYFVEEEGCHLRVVDAVRERVSFRRLNLLEPASFLGEAPFDIVFCRNVLIYFDDQGRRSAFRGLDQGLAPEGLLCVGHADALTRITPAYRRVGPPGAFCYQRKPVSEASTVPATDKVPAKALPRKAKRRAVAPPSMPRPLPLPKNQPAKPAPQESDGSLTKARSAADHGKLSEAETLCREALSTSPGSVEALHLLAELLLAQKKIPDGEAQLRRVVYLAPNHREALFRLALLAEQRGDEREAANWRRRAAKQSLEPAKP